MNRTKARPTFTHNLKYQLTKHTQPNTSAQPPPYPGSFCQFSLWNRDLIVVGATGPNSRPGPIKDI